MRGWKTWAGGLALVASGVGAIAQVIASGEFSFEKIQAGLALIGAGLAVWGIGHKIDKATP